MASKYEVHPIANVFPMMSNDEFKALKADIKEHGLREPIVFWKNMLVDGRNRLKACEDLGIEADESELMDETDPVAWVISHNLHRRHLDESQKAMVAAKLAKLKHGDNQHTKEDGPIGLSIKDASKMVNCSERSTKRAKKVIAEGANEVQQAVERGELPVSVASDFVKAVPDKKEQSEILKQGAQSVKDKVKESKPNKQDKRQKTETIVDNRTPQQKKEGLPIVKNPASSAIQFAKLAIGQLDRIQPRDKGRKEALQIVFDYLKDRLKLHCDECETLRTELAKNAKELQATRKNLDVLRDQCAEFRDLNNKLLKKSDTRSKALPWSKPEEVIV